MYRMRVRKLFVLNMHQKYVLLYFLPPTNQKRVRRLLAGKRFKQSNKSAKKNARARPVKVTTDDVMKFKRTNQSAFLLLLSPLVLAQFGHPLIVPADHCATRVDHQPAATLTLTLQGWARLVLARDEEGLGLTKLGTAAGGIFSRHPNNRLSPPQSISALLEHCHDIGRELDPLTSLLTLTSNRLPRQDVCLQHCNVTVAISK